MENKGMPVAREEASTQERDWEEFETRAPRIASIQKRTLLAAAQVALADLDGYPGRLVPEDERCDGGSSESAARRIARELERLAEEVGRVRG